MRVQTDVHEEAQAERLFDQALRASDTLDTLMNNAGIDASGKPVAEMPSEVWDRAIKTNLYGYFHGSHRSIGTRRQAGGGGKIINVTSVREEIPRAGAADYDCAEGAERNLARTLTLELAVGKTNVNSI